MDLLDRLRPRWRHPDPAVRAAAVRDMTDADGERLGSVATDDPDAGVRRIAIRRLADAALLERVAAEDADPSLREVAAERLRAVLLDVAVSGAPVEECEAALARLVEPRQLAQAAASAAHAPVRSAALARVSGDRALRDVVRTAADPAIRAAALVRIEDPAVLRGIAVSEGSPELGLQALEHVADPAALDAIAGTRTAPKAVRQRARAMLAELAGERPVLGLKEARARQQELSNLVHTLRATADPASAAARVEEALREWDAIARAVAPKPDVADAFAAACDAILEDAGSLARRHAAAEQARAAIAESLAARAALCERVEADAGDAGTPRALGEVRAAWSRLAPVPDDEGVPLWRRFSAACEAAAARHQAWRANEARVAELARAVDEAEALADAPGPASKAWKEVERRWTSLDRSAGDRDRVDELERRFAAARDRLRARRAEGEQRRAEVERQNLARLEALCGRARDAAAAETLRPAVGRRELEALEAALGDLGPLPGSERRAAWTERLTEAREALLRRVAQAEQTEEWRRWANVAAQEELIARVEALLEAKDLAEGTRQLVRLQEEWSAVATASPDKSQALWERFRTARNELRRRCDAYMAENLEKKRALCVEVAGAGDSTSWNETAELVRRAQAAWKEIGPVPGKHAKAIWQQFREPCDRFFARRKEHFDRIDAERGENAKQKVALCEQAEALADSTDWDATTDAMKRLQAEWKRGGPPPRDRADALWARFKTACDRFFDRRSRRHELAREEAIRKAHALCDGVEALVERLRSDAPADDGVGRAIDEAWSEWIRLGLGGGDEARALDARLRAACEAVATLRPDALAGTRFDPDATRKRREKLCARLEALAGEDAAAPRATSLQDLALALREKLAANTIAGGAGRGGGVGKQDVAREVERIAASWATLGPPLDDAARALAERFERARARVR
jgi:hypothetical protein